jgi:cobalamin biosynthesis Mg chelatase CobN
VVTTTSVSDTNVQASNPPPANTAAADPSTKGPGKGKATKTPTAEPTVVPTTEPTDDGSLKVVGSTQTYETSAEPVESKSAPVWVVPGILLMLTSMLALLGGVLGRGKGTAKEKA